MFHKIYTEDANISKYDEIVNDALHISSEKLHEIPLIFLKEIEPSDSSIKRE